MKLTSSLGAFAASGVFLCLLAFSSCGSGSEKTEVAKNAGVNPPASNSLPVSSATPVTSSTPAESPVTNAGSNQTAKSDKRRVTDPQPEIGTGGNDFFLFTKTRSALAADPDLKAATIIVEVKGGVLTLNGTIPNAALRMKAEQLVRSVEGVKEVRNRLRIST